MELLPQDILNKIYDYYLGFVNCMARKIQHWYREYSATCCDCRRVRPRGKLVEAQSCDDAYGCCFKRVCGDMCSYQCDNGHSLYNQCPLRFYDSCFYDHNEPCDQFEYEDHRIYASQNVRCNQCELNVVIYRDFEFDSWYDAHRTYERIYKTY